MIFKPNCVLCSGSGIILDPDPIEPARLCHCAALTPVHCVLDGIPSRYRDANINDFWEWWKLQYSEKRLTIEANTAYNTLERAKDSYLANSDWFSKLDLIVHKCGPTRDISGEISWKDLKPAQEPQGYRSLFNWAQHDGNSSNFWWIHGLPGSGKSTFSVAILKKWCESFNKSGLFISVRSFSLELKGNRNFKHVAFVNESDKIVPLLKASCLVLDDFDRMDADMRVVRALAQILDHRYNEELPTLITATKGADILQRSNVELYPLLKLDDVSLMKRLEASRRVVLQPTLISLLEERQNNDII